MTIDTMRSAVRRWLPDHLAIALLAFSAVSAAAQAPARYEGRPVAEVLGELQRRGAPIIFSSVLVRSDLRVKSEPRSEPGTRAFVEEILAPHGLGVADGPGKTWVVTRVRRDPKPATPARGSVPTEEGREPEAPVPIRIEERVTVQERPGDLAGSPNAYALDPVRATNTAGSLENLVQALPGMVPGVAATNDHEGKLAVRGAGPQHNTIVFDGVQIHSPERMASDLGGWQSFVNPATIASWALDPSGLDARYGGRLSSTTVFETRDGATDRRLALSGSFGLTSGDILAEGRLPGTETGSWWATMRGTYYRLVTDRFQDGDVPSFVDGQFKIAASPTTRTRLSVVGLAGAEGMVRPILAPPDQRGPYGDNNLKEFHASSGLAIATLQWSARRVSSTTTVDVYSSVRRHQDGWIDWQTGEPFDRRVRIVDVAGRQRFTIGWAPGKVLDFGGEVKRIRGTWRMAGMDHIPRRAPGPDTWGQFLAYDGPIDARSRRTQVGGWAQQRIPLGGGVAIEPGIRADWNSSTGETSVQPRFRLTKSVGERGMVWIGGAWQAQTPGFETMQQGLAYVDLAGAAASDVRNERSRQVVAGFAHQFAGSVTLRAEVYRRVFDRLLVQRQETEGERQQRLSRYELPPDMPADSAILEYRPTTDPESTGTGRAAGFELLLERSRGRVTGWITYTLSKSEREIFGRTVPFEFDRRHAVAAAVNVEITRKVRAAVRSQYGSGFPVTPLHPEVRFNDSRNTWPGPPPGTLFQAGRDRNGNLITRSDLLDPPRLSLLNSARMSPYARTDVRVSYALHERFDVYGEVINLFDRENFGINVPDVSDRVGRPVDYQLAPYFPRLFTYGVRFAF
jgi:hypothetical protein